MAKKRVEKGVAGMELLVCRNPKAAQLYDIEDKLEVGMVLTGSEVKSLRNRKADLDGAYAVIENDELFLHKMHIAPYAQTGYTGHVPKAVRKLLAHREEIDKWRGKLTTKGYTLVPLQVYFKNGVAKCQLGLGRGKKKGDEREALKAKAELNEARDAARRR